MRLADKVSDGLSAKNCIKVVADLFLRRGNIYFDKML